MREGLTELVFILDKSGSMAGLESDTIGGFNGMIEKQKKEPGAAVVSTVLFATNSDVIHDRVPIEKVKNLSEKDYHVGGCTALIDAIGCSIHHISQVHKYARKEDVPGKTIFIITTDGMENSSKLYSYSDIKEMIEKQRNDQNWDFFFLGANIDAIEAAARIGISPSRSVRFQNDKQGIAVNYETINRTIRHLRKWDIVTDDWKVKIQMDYIARR